MNPRPVDMDVFRAIRWNERSSAIVECRRVSELRSHVGGDDHSSVIPQTFLWIEIEVR